MGWSIAAAEGILKWTTVSPEFNDTCVAGLKRLASQSISVGLQSSFTT